MYLYKKSFYKVLGITLARGGSKGIENKNIAFINNKPLIYYTIKEALKSNFIDDYVVSTDSKKIREISLRYGAQVPFIRPKRLSTDKASSVSALKHAVNFMEKQNKCKYDIVVELMCTNPLKDCNDIDLCISKIVKKKADSVIAMHELTDHHPIRIKKIINEKIYDFNLYEDPESRRQDLKPKAYIRSGSIYTLTRKHLMIDSRRYGSNKSYAYILKPEKAINIDGPDDLVLAKHKLKKLNTKSN